MAKVGDSDTLERCLQRLSNNTAHPERFLSVQEALAEEFTALTKTLYDLHKATKLVACEGSPLDQLVVENFDEEQIWQELELQNVAVLTHFEEAVGRAVTEDTLTVFKDTECEEGGGDEKDVDDDEDFENEEEDDNGKERKHRLKSKASAAEEQEDCSNEDFSNEDSDVDFDVDELEKQAKHMKNITAKLPKSGTAVSEVDDDFFKLSEMEAFLDDMDRMEGKGAVGEEVDYFQDLPSDEDEELTFDKPAVSKSQKKPKSSRNLKYKDFFKDDGPVDQHEPDERDESTGDDEEGDDDDDYEDEKGMDEEDFSMEEGDDETQKARDTLRKVTFDLPSDNEGEDVEDILGGKQKKMANPGSKSSFEKRQEKMAEKIDKLEKAALAEKPWQLSGEIAVQSRPENSMLEEDLAFDQASRMAPAVTEETTLHLEDIIKQRIKDQAWDDVVRKEKPKEDVFEYKKRLTLDHEKSKLSLAEVYEQEYLKQTQEKTEEEEENPAHTEIQKLLDSLFLKLDALSNFHFTPKPHIPEVKVVSNLPSIAMEEVAPVGTSDATLLAPEEIKEKNKAGDILGNSEKLSTDKKRERRLKKKVKQRRIKEREKRKKLKEAARGGEGNKRTSKAEAEETLRKLTKGGKAKILTNDGMDKALRSSQAFFSQLQDQVRSEIKGSKGQAAKKKHKEVSASKLKL
ncbi:U3 small nucleolar ribonucleoprotein protein MPP10 [Electrophorus electricus]|uniref:U3 small nucleolar ribonucleoprotein protein MPP10 n=1 Tax=Electrophorus electricus TaxID=8005 RepID=UPI0015CFE3B3|nr:U3 small nucleolar ribonucleoprotein protein MPP10 [Electrophorus electricus]